LWADDYSYYYFQRSAIGEWSSLQRLFPDANIPPSNIKLVVNRQGVLYAFTNSFCGMTNAENICYSSRGIDGIWTPLVFVSAGSCEDIIVDEVGILHVVYSNKGIYYFHIEPGQAPSLPVLISTLVGDISTPQIAVGSDQTLHVIWHNGAFSLIYAQKTITGNWTDAQQILSGFIGHYSIQVDPANNVNVLASTHFLHKFSEANWDTVVDVAPPMTFNLIDDLSFLIQPDKTIHIVGVNSNNNIRNLLYIRSIKVDQTGDSHLSQVLNIPDEMTHPIFSFLYQLSGVSPIGNRQLVLTVSSNGTTVTIDGINEATNGWVHKWYDLSSWTGKTINLAFNLQQEQGSSPAWAVIDEVTVGSGSPDIWIRSSASGNAIPGNSVTISFTYGNQSGVQADAVTIAAILPDKLTFVSADPMPTSVTGQVLAWDVGDLAGRSELFTIQLKATVASDAPFFTTLEGSAEIGTTSPELEKANNTIQINTFIGTRVMLPVLRK